MILLGSERFADGSKLSKDNTMRHHNSVMHGLLQHVPWSMFDQLVEDHGADARVRRLSTKSQFVGLLYGQLAGAVSLRDGLTAIDSLVSVPGENATAAECRPVPLPLPRPLPRPRSRPRSLRRARPSRRRRSWSRAPGSGSSRTPFRSRCRPRHIDRP